MKKNTPEQQPPRPQPTDANQLAKFIVDLATAGGDDESQDDKKAAETRWAKKRAGKALEMIEADKAAEEAPATGAPPIAVREASRRVAAGRQGS